jgi:gamma-glutamylputrescine oxidase
MYSYSYWENEQFFLNNDLIIIGSGIVGLSTALFYKKKNPKARVLILERGAIPSGASTRNAGFACYGSLGELSDNLESHELNELINLMERRYQGLKLLRETLGDSNIDFIECGSYELFTEEKDYQNALKNIQLFNKECLRFLPSDAFSVATEKIKDYGFSGVNHLIFNQFEGSLNSGKIYNELLLKCLKIGIKILNGIEVESIDFNSNSVQIKNTHSIKFGKLILCSNAFSKQLIPEIDVIPGRGLILVSKPILDLKLNGIYHMDKGYIYFRNIGNRLLIGGGRNLDFKGEETHQFGTNILIKEALLKLAKNQILPYTIFDTEFEWSGIMAFGKNKYPIVKHLKNNVYCAVKMGGMGVAIGSIIGKEASEMLSV